MQFNRSLWINYATNETTVSYQFLDTEEIDPVKVTDSILLAALGEGEKPGVVITKYDSETTPSPARSKRSGASTLFRKISISPIAPVTRMTFSIFQTRTNAIHVHVFFWRKNRSPKPSYSFTPSGGREKCWMSSRSSKT